MVRLPVMLGRIFDRLIGGKDSVPHPTICLPINCMVAQTSEFPLGFLFNLFKSTRLSCLIAPHHSLQASTTVGGTTIPCPRLVLSLFG
jgi:hypothetical protein